MYLHDGVVLRNNYNVKFSNSHLKQCFANFVIILVDLTDSYFLKKKPYEYMARALRFS
jgi:uncharacterized protein YvpB